MHIDNLNNFSLTFRLRKLFNAAITMNSSIGLFEAIE